MTTRRQPPDVARAADLYGQAMRQAERLGARPLSACCHLGLGSLYRRARQGEEARVHLATAGTWLREMHMRLWSDRVDEELRLLER